MDTEHKPNGTGYVIEKGVPLSRYRNENDQSKYGLHEMEVGDSIFFAIPAAKLRNAAWGFGRKRDLKFAVRSVEGGCRIWRME